MPPRPTRQTERVLLVEGVNDKFVIVHLWKRRNGTEPPFTVFDTHGESDPESYDSGSAETGVDALLASISSRIKERGRSAVGIVVDANGSAERRWKAIVDELSTVDIDVTERFNSQGTILEPEGRSPRVGIWIMPDNQSGGELEKFVETMIPPSDPIWPLSKEYIEKVLSDIPRDRRPLREEKATKAIMHSWLATRTEPRPMGRAIEAGDLSTDGELCLRFVSWLERLFESP